MFWTTGSLCQSDDVIADVSLSKIGALEGGGGS